LGGVEPCKPPQRRLGKDGRLFLALCATRPGKLVQKSTSSLSLLFGVPCIHFGQYIL
jgi:hypothetical protein